MKFSGIAVQLRPSQSVAISRRLAAPCGTTVRHNTIYEAVLHSRIYYTFGICDLLRRFFSRDVRLNNSEQTLTERTPQARRGGVREKETRGGDLSFGIQPGVAAPVGADTYHVLDLRLCGQSMCGLPGSLCDGLRDLRHISDLCCLAVQFCQFVEISCDCTVPFF